jgi:hypothetical protein
MKPHDWFGVGVRLFALYPLTLAVEQFLFLVDLRLGQLSGRWSGSSVGVDPTAYLFSSFGYFLFSLALLRAAPALVAFAYPSRNPEPVEETDAD